MQAQDSVLQKTKQAQKIAPISDSASKQVIKKHLSKPAFSPRTAAIRSAIIPGWGQAYNKRYWKIPLVWGALGTTAGIFVYNLKYYKLLRNAYNIRETNDSAAFGQIDPRFVNLSTDALQSYRDSFRQDIDYSALFFLLFWGLNVVDATVDAHLKGFDVGNNLTLKVKPSYNPFLDTKGLSLVLNFRDKH